MQQARQGLRAPGAAPRVTSILVGPIQLFVYGVVWATVPCDMISRLFVIRSRRRMRVPCLAFPHGAASFMRMCRPSSVLPGLAPPRGRGAPGACRRGPDCVSVREASTRCVDLYFAPSVCLCLFVVPPTHCVTLIRDSSDRGLIARVSSLVCRVINRDSLPHAIGYILTAWSSSSFVRLCGSSSVSVGLPPTGDRGSGG